MKVWPQTATVRNLMKHSIGRWFPARGYVNWPNDMFTKRRLRDGSVADWYVGARFVGRGLLRADASVSHP